MKELTLNLKSIADKVSISDGYHTFDELYDHRITLYIALCRMIAELYNEKGEGIYPWKSRLHSDGSNYDGWFILGVNVIEGEQITYHIPNERWDDCDFAEELKQAPKFDGHTSQDVLERINNL